MDNLSEKELKAIQDLKQIFSLELEKKEFATDFYFYRYLKDKYFNVKAAEVAVRKNIEWRIKNNVDTILSDHVLNELLREIIEKVYFADDKEGCKVYYVAMSKIDIIGLQMSFKFSEMEKNFIYALEMHEKDSRDKCTKKDGDIGGAIHIWDMENLNFAKATNKRGLEDLIRFTKLFENHYPEIFKAIFVINVSIYFVMGYNLIKTFVPLNIKEKLRIFGTEGYQEALLEMIDAEKLPKFLGGTLADPDGDPLCKNLVYHGGPIPEKYYMKNNKKLLVNSEGVEKLVLSRASFYEIEVQVDEVGSVIQWEFEIKSRDIGFGLFYKEIVDGEMKITELVPLMRLDAVEFPESGMYKTDKVGTYILLFDNSYSWIRSKEIFYKMSVVSLESIEKNTNI